MKNGKVKGTIAVLPAGIIARKVIIALVFSFAILTAIVSVNATVPTLSPPLDFDKFMPEEITFDKSGDSWVLTDGEGDIIGIEISGYMESIALLKKRFAVDTSKPLTIEYKIRFDFRDSSSDATVNIFLDPPSEEDWWNDPIGVGHNGEINGDVLNFLHSFGPGDSPYGNWGGKVGICDDVEGGDLPYRSAPYPTDGEWVTVRVLVSETGFEVVCVGEEGYYRKESCAYDLSDVEYIGVGFGDQCMSKVEVDWIKLESPTTAPSPTPTVERYIYAKSLKNKELEKAALVKTEILPSTEEGYNDLVIEIHPLEPKVALIAEFWWQIPHHSRDITKPVECAVGEIRIGYGEDVSILNSQSSVLYCYPDSCYPDSCDIDISKQHLVEDTNEGGDIELTRSVVQEVIGFLSRIPGVGIIIDEIFEWMKGSPIDASNSPQHQYFTDANWKGSIVR